jgi:hypothetical protein
MAAMKSVTAVRMRDSSVAARDIAQAGASAPVPAANNRGARLRRGIVHVLIGVVALDLLTLWLPLVRAVADGSSYGWGTYGLEGKGVGGQYLGIVALAALALTIIVLGWRTRSRAFRWLMLLWQLPSGFLGVIAAASGELQFKGETLGIDLTIPVPVVLVLFLYVAPAILALYWGARDRTAERGPKPRWGRINSALLALAIAVIPVQFTLLRTGEPGSAADAIGVILTIAQWLTIVTALAPWDTRKTTPQERRNVARPLLLACDRSTTNSVRQPSVPYASRRSSAGSSAILAVTSSGRRARRARPA